MQPTPDPAHVPARHAVDWALYSKTPGRVMDYDILAGSLPVAEAIALVRAGLTGQPDGPADGRPEALPWITFLGGSADRPGFAVNVMAWSEERDGTGQAIAPSRLLWLPWAMAARTTLDCRSAVRLLTGLGWDQLAAGPPGVTGTEPLLLPDPPPADPEELAELVDGIGFDWVAKVAAALVDGGQVVVTTEGRMPSPSERLALIDAICALLPYAQRARLSIATWANHRAAHGIRLSFAAGSFKGQAEARLDTRTAPVPRTAEGKAYLDTVYRLLDRRFTVAALVRHLAQQRDPASCPDAVSARTALLNLDLPAAVHEEIRSGRGTLDRVRYVLVHLNGWQALPEPAMRREYATFLGRQAASTHDQAGEAGAILRQAWTPEVAQHLAAIAATDLVQGSTARLRVWLTIEAAALPPAGRSLLSETARGVHARSSASARRRLAELLIESDRDDPVHRLLLQDPTWGGPVLAALNGTPTSGNGPDRLDQLLDLWCRHVPEATAGWLTPLLVAAGWQVEVQTTGLAEIRHWSESTDVLVSLARQRRNQAVLLGPLWPETIRWAVRRMGHAGTALRHLLGEIPVHHLDDAAAARHDLLSLLSGGGPSALARHHDGPTEQYLDSFRDGWTGPDLASVRRVLGDSLLRALAGQNASAANLRLLVRLVDFVAPERWEETAQQVRDYLGRHPDQWPHLRLTDDQARRVDGWLPAVRRLADLARADADVTAVERACRDVLDRRPPLQDVDVVAALAPWLRPERLPHVVDLLLRLSFTTPDAPSRVFADRLRAHLCAGQRGIDPHNFLNVLWQRHQELSWQVTALGTWLDEGAARIDQERSTTDKPSLWGRIWGGRSGDRSSPTPASDGGGHGWME